MNDMCKSQVEDIIGSFASDSTGLPETSAVRARERRDSHIFYFRDWHNIRTPRGMAETRMRHIYINSFSRKLNIFDEDGRVQLCPLSKN